MNTIWNTGRTSLGLGWAALVFGGWLVISPFALGFAHETTGIANNVITGLVLILLTLASTRNGLLRALFVLLGGWLYIAAFSLSVSNGRFLWNDLIVGFLVIICAVASETPYPQNDSSRAS